MKKVKVTKNRAFLKLTVALLCEVPPLPLPILRHKLLRPPVPEPEWMA